jgi:hypothetical protein
VESGEMITSESYGEGSMRIWRDCRIIWDLEAAMIAGQDWGGVYQRSGISRKR